MSSEENEYSKLHKVTVTFVGTNSKPMDEVLEMCDLNEEFMYDLYGICRIFYDISQNSNFSFVATVKDDGFFITVYLNNDETETEEEVGDLFFKFESNESGMGVSEIENEMDDILSTGW